jgi:hypothetical protein
VLPVEVTAPADFGFGRLPGGLSGRGKREMERMKWDRY